jgi:hypothetical protein
MSRCSSVTVDRAAECPDDPRRPLGLARDERVSASWPVSPFALIAGRRRDHFDGDARPHVDEPVNLGRLGTWQIDREIRHSSPSARDGQLGSGAGDEDATRRPRIAEGGLRAT